MSRSRTALLPLGLLALAACAGLQPYASVRARLPAGARIELGGQTVHVEQRGTGEPVVLLHGFGESTYSYRAIAPALAERYRVIAIDLNGFGYTERPRDPAAYTLDGQRRLVLAVLDRLGVESAHFVGHSYGGGLVLWLAAQQPQRVRSMTLIATTLPSYSSERRSRGANLRALSFVLLRGWALRERAIARALRNVYHDDALATPEVVRAYLERLRIEGMGDAYYGLTAHNGEPPAEVELAAIRVPALLIWGRQDSRTPLADGERIAAALPAARLEVLDACGHAPAEERPGEVLAALAPFLAAHALDPVTAAGEPPPALPPADSPPRRRAAALAGGDLLVRCGRLIDGVAATPRGETWVSIRGGTIVAVGDRPREGGDGPLLDLATRTCLPGLLDLHTHLADAPEDTADLRVFLSRSEEQALERARAHALSTLRAGFTTVRDVGTYVAWADRALRDEIDAGRTLGPRLQVVGMYLTVPGGGGDLLIPGVPEEQVPQRVRRGVARGAAAFRERATAVVAGGADAVKVIASGAVLAYGGVPGAPEMSEEELRAVVEVAHRHGLRVAAHAHGAESVKDAIRAGADTIEHASLIDDEGIALARQHGVCLDMDVYNGDYIDSEGRRQGWPEEFLRKNLETTGVQREAFRRALAAGALLSYGTDAAVYPHGLNARQLSVMVGLGMSPMQAIQAATSVAARCIGWEGRVGALRPGLAGDLIAVDGDPLVDIAALERVGTVVLGGRVVKAE